MDRSEADLLARSLRQVVEDNSGPPLDDALDELGWAEALTHDPAVAVSSLFEWQGWANASSGALDLVLAYGLGLAGGPAVVLPELGHWTAPGERPARVRGVGTGRLARAQSAVVVSAQDDKHVAALVAVGQLGARTVAGIDPWYGLSEVDAEGADLGAELETVDWPAGLALAQLAVGHELVGAARRMLELAREHALARVQFGQTISHFQAVRHRLAETLVAVEGAQALLEAAWLDLTPVSAAIAKAVAGRSARTAARHAQQVLAGIGFTEEHPLHRYVRRVLLLDQLLGSGDRLTRRLGEHLIESRRLPDPVAL